MIKINAVLGEDAFELADFGDLGFPKTASTNRDPQLVKRKRFPRNGQASKNGRHRRNTTHHELPSPEKAAG